MSANTQEQIPQALLVAEPVAEKPVDLPVADTIPELVQPSPIRRGWRLFRTMTMTLLVLVGSAVVGWLGMKEFSFTLAGWSEGQYHHVVANGLWNPSWGEFGIWASGILLFGLLVESSAGSVRTLILMLAGASGACFGYWLFNTPEGLVEAEGAAEHVFGWLMRNRGPEDALWFAAQWGNILEAMQWQGIIAGGAGICGALMANAVVRRGSGDGYATVRPVKLLTAVVFLVVLAFAWSSIADRTFPTVLFVGGFLGGLAILFPEKVIELIWNSIRNARD